MQMLIHHLLNLRILVPHQHYVALLRQPSEDIKSLRPDLDIAIRRRIAISTGQAERRVDNQLPQPGTIAQREPHNLREFVLDFGVGRYLELDVADQAAAALVQGCERGHGGVDGKVEDVFVVEHGPGFFVHCFVRAEDVDDEWILILRPAVRV